MSVKKTLGGDRIGSGKKMQVELDGYVRSNFDLSQIWRSSQAPGTVVPCYVNIGQKGDTWKFDLSSMVRTKPTTGPLYGSFKLEVLFFAADIRLYNGALHNNALNMGMEMQNVVYPKIQIPVRANQGAVEEGESLAWQIQKQNMNPSALMAYLGVTNPGSTKIVGAADPELEQVGYRYFNGMPILMYWDVVKNYLINKQESQAWYIGAAGIPATKTQAETTTQAELQQTSVEAAQVKQVTVNNVSVTYQQTIKETKTTISAGASGSSNTFDLKLTGTGATLLSRRLILYLDNIISTKKEISINPLDINIITNANDVSVEGTANKYGACQYDQATNAIFFTFDKTIMDNNNLQEGYETVGSVNTLKIERIIINKIYVTTTENPEEPENPSNPDDETGVFTEMQLKSFPIENLDKARGIVLKNFFTGENVTIKAAESTDNPQDTINFEPFNVPCKVFKNGTLIKLHNAASQNGLAIKTYSNDIFNAFLNTDTIEKINEQTAATISNGQLQISSLILAEKIYKLQNKIAVAGGTYEDWQEAVYGISTAPANESPRFIGGLTSEIVFDEVVSSSATEIGGETSPLGALGGRGSLNGKKGGQFELEVKEDCIIMGLCIITPRIDYSQGNKWFMSLQNNDQLHKPELDRIGFQNLIGDWMCGADTQISLTQPGWGQTKAYAKQPAWEHYMTAVNECHGDFADQDKAMYMTLNRRYELKKNSEGVLQIADFTSYIDPTKYNYAFADTTIESQNFWVQVGMDIMVRRVMSSKVMPNL